MRQTKPEALLRCLFDELPDAVFVFDPSTLAIVDANPAAERFTGLSQYELSDATLSDVVDGPLPHGVNELQAISGTTGTDDEYCLRPVEGPPLAVSLRFSTVAAASGVHGLAIARDISRWKRVEDALCKRTGQFREWFTKAPDAIFIEDLEGYVLDVNPAACRLHQLDPDDLIGKHVLELVPPDRRDEVRHDFARLVAGEIDHVDGYSWTSDRQEVPVELRVSHTDYRGRPALLLHVRDISERRRKEQEDRQNTAAVARLASLSPREHDVKELVVAGKTSRIIAEELGISIKTVETHRANMMRKLRVDKVADLVRLVLTAQQLQGDS